MKLNNLFKAAIFLLLFSGVSPAFAQWQSLVVDLRDADPVVLDISSTLAVSFENGIFTISDTDTFIEFPMNDVVAVSHSRRPFNIATGNEQASLPADERKITLRPGTVLLSGFADGETLTIYTPDGSVVLSRPVAGETEVSLQTLGKGIFILNIGGLSCKIRNI